MIIRNTFPKVYKMEDSKTGYPYWLVDARSKKWGFNQRPTFRSEKEALERARTIADKIARFGAQPDIPIATKTQAEAYAKLVDRLSFYSKTPEEAVTFYLTHLGDEVLRQAKPKLSTVIDKWRDGKLESKIKPIGKRMEGELKFYARWMATKWGELKIDEVTHQMVEDELNKLPAGNRNTHRKYLRFIRMFFIWAKHKRHLHGENPTDGIKIKSEDFTARFYSPEDVSKILRYIATHHEDLVGMYALMAFGGLRPTESARAQWEDIDFETHEIYVRKGKREERRFILESPARETLFAWLQWCKDRSKKDQPFVRSKNLNNREKKIHTETMNGEWIQDGFRHGFATNYNALTQDPYKVCHVTGDIIKTVRRHYMRAVTKKKCDGFWGLTPTVVLAG